MSRSTKTYARKGGGPKKSASVFDSLFKKASKEPGKFDEEIKSTLFDSSTESSFFNSNSTKEEIKFKPKLGKSRPPLLNLNGAHTHKDSSKHGDISETSNNTKYGDSSAASNDTNDSSKNISNDSFKNSDIVFKHKVKAQPKNTEDQFDALLFNTKPSKEKVAKSTAFKNYHHQDDITFKIGDDSPFKIGSPFTDSSPNQTKDSTHPSGDEDLLFTSFSKLSSKVKVEEEDDYESVPEVKENRVKRTIEKKKSRKNVGSKAKSRNSLKRPARDTILKSNETLDFVINYRVQGGESPEKVKENDKNGGRDILSEVEGRPVTLGGAVSSLVDLISPKGGHSQRSQKVDHSQRLSVDFLDRKASTETPDISSFIFPPNNQRGNLHSTPLLKSKSSIEKLSQKLGSLDSSQESANISQDDVFLSTDLQQDSPVVPSRLLQLSPKLTDTFTLPLTSLKESPPPPSTSITSLKQTIERNEKLEDFVEGADEGSEEVDEGNESMEVFEMTPGSKSNQRVKVSEYSATNPSVLHSSVTGKVLGLNSGSSESSSAQEEEKTFRRVNTRRGKIMAGASKRIESWEQKSIALKLSKSEDEQEGSAVKISSGGKSEEVNEISKDSGVKNSDCDEKSDSGGNDFSHASNKQRKVKEFGSDKVRISEDKSPLKSIENIGSCLAKRNSKSPSEKMKALSLSSVNSSSSQSSVSSPSATIEAKIAPLNQIVDIDSNETLNNDKTCDISRDKTDKSLNTNKIPQNSATVPDQHKSTNLNQSSFNKMSDASILEMAVKDGFDINESILFAKPKQVRPKLKLKDDNKKKQEASKPDEGLGLNDEDDDEVAVKSGKAWRRSIMSLSSKLYPQRRMSSALFQRSVLETPCQMLPRPSESFASSRLAGSFRQSSFQPNFSINAPPNLSMNAPSKFSMNAPPNPSKFSMNAPPNPSKFSMNATPNPLKFSMNAPPNPSKFSMNPPLPPNPPERTRQSTRFTRQSTFLPQTLPEESEEVDENDEQEKTRIDETFAATKERRSSLEVSHDGTILANKFSQNLDLDSTESTKFSFCVGSTPRITPGRASFCIVPHEVGATPSTAKKSLFSSRSSVAVASSNSSVAGSDSTTSTTLSTTLSSGDVSVLLETEVSDEQKLLSRCSRQEIVAFEDVYCEDVMRAAKKVGEGAFGEVYLIGCDGPAKPVLKVVPVGGDVDVNDEPQTSLEEMLSEVVISKSLSCLRTGSSNRTEGFVEVRNCHLFQGVYPEKLLQLWDHFDEEKTSENYRPDYLPTHQLYIALEFNNGGRDLEKYEFSNATQALAAWRQVIHTVACAEEELEFEHRDLHWGNVLIKETKETTVNFKLGGDTFQVATQGVLITIIDFSLSRLTSQEDSVTIFKDLSTDPTIFMGKGKDKKGGDYQFDIYRKMKKEIGNDWKKFCPKTNIFWMHYMLDKMSATDGVYYKGKKTAKAHRSGISIINALKKRLIDDYESATMYVRREGDRIN